MPSSKRGTLLSTFFAVIATLFTVTLSGNAFPAGDPNYPFKDAYPLVGSPAYPVQLAHGLLSVPQPRIRQAERFNVNICVYNDHVQGCFYNAYWQGLIPRPGVLALYDAQKHYICDLTEWTNGSRREVRDADWETIQPGGYVGVLADVSLPYPSYVRIPAGTYYLQVIYLTYAVINGSFPRTLKIPSKELFRSNAVQITVVN